MQRLSRRTAALLLLAVTVVIWAAYLVVARAATRAALGPVEIGLLRYLLPALLFAPVWLRMGPKPKAASWTDAAIIAGGGGFVFLALLATGLQYAPVADSGVFAPSMLPFFVAVLSFVLLGERFTTARLAGFALILVGALSVGGYEALAHASDGSWRGHLLFLAASFLWATYTVVFRRSGIGALEAAAMMSLWSAAAFLLWSLVAGADFSGLSWRFLGFQVLMQGLLSGFLATFTFGYAATVLGASQTAATAALVPVLAALGGLLFLGEPVSALKWAGIGVVACGVLLASGAVRFRGPPAPPP